MSCAEDLTGQRFGKLVALFRVSNHPNGRTQWMCRCDCGKNHIVLSTCLKQGNVKSCGCSWYKGRKIKEIRSGIRFGHYTVIKSLGVRVIKYGNGKTCKRQFFLCKCDCGKVKEVSVSELKSSEVYKLKSCRCKKELRK